MSAPQLCSVCESYYDADGLLSQDDSSSSECSQCHLAKLQRRNEQRATTLAAAKQSNMGLFESLPTKVDCLRDLDQTLLCIGSPVLIRRQFRQEEILTPKAQKPAIEEILKLITDNTGYRFK